MLRNCKKQKIAIKFSPKIDIFIDNSIGKKETLKNLQQAHNAQE